MTEIPKTDIGFCIYCHSTEPPLTREHVMPRGLGGNVPPGGAHEAMVLQNATCESCRQITQRIEEGCLLDAFGPARKRLGLTRKDRATGKSKAHIVRFDETSDNIEVDDIHIPGALMIPSYRMSARFLPEGDWRGPDLKVIVTREASFPSDEVQKIGVAMTCNIPMFARLLAKIAYGVAVYHVGLDNFVPTITPLILREDVEYRWHVGGFCEEIPEPEKSEHLHTAKIRHHEGLLGVDIQLFREYGGPINYVIVGYDKRQLIPSRLRV